MIETMLKEPTLKDVDIVVKCKKYPQFKKQLEEICKAYDTDINMSIYANLQKIQEGKYFEILKRDKLYVNFYGYKLEKLSEDDLNKVYLLWIMKMDEQIRNNIKRKYTVNYFHNMSTTLTPFIFVRDTYKKLPIQYYALLDKIYVVEASFLIKNAGMFQFGRLYKLYSRRILFVQTLKQFSKIEEVKKNMLIEQLPQPIKMEQTYALEKARKQKSQSEIIAVNSLSLPNISMSSVMKKQQKKDCLTIKLQQHKFTENGYPIHLITLIQTMRKNPNMLQIQGIFRKSGSIQQEQQIILQLSKMDKVGVLKPTENGMFCGYAVAGVIKKIFTKLRQPIVPYSIYNKVMALQGIKQQDEIPLVRDIIGSLPDLNRNIILYVINFIRKQVLQHQQNKMNFYSMSVVLSPCFFRPQVSSLQDLLNSGRYASIINILFKKYQDVAPQEQNMFINKSPQKQKRGSRQSSGRGSGPTHLEPLNTNTL